MPNLFLMKPSIALITTLALTRTASAIGLQASACSGLSADQLDQEQAAAESAPWETSFSTITSYALPNLKLALIESPQLIYEEADTYECGDNRIGVKDTTVMGEYYYQFIYLGSSKF
jgi:L-cystine uptake protein TcyP (sodium:dicarboxylate symporter family)